MSIEIEEWRKHARLGGREENEAGFGPESKDNTTRLPWIGHWGSQRARRWETPGDL